MQSQAHNVVLMPWLVAGAMLLALGAPTAAQEAFIRGDVDGDGRHLVTDAVRIFLYLFQGDASVEECLDAADVNDDGRVGIDDGIYLLNYLFRGGPRLEPPFPFCGPDPTEDELGCEREMECGGSFSFCGQELTADAVVFLIDRSASMTGSGELSMIKQETMAAILSFHPSMRFAVVFFAGETMAFPPWGELASTGSTEIQWAAVDYITGVPGGGQGSCPLAAFERALELLRRSPPSRGLIVYAGDGGGTCGEVDELSYLQNMVEEVTRANQGLAAIECFGVLIRGREAQEGFLIQLAERNRGRYFRIE
jgi:hypothetical protein